MKLYIYTDVLTDWTWGMAIVAADSREAADSIAAKDIYEDLNDPGYWAQAQCREIPVDPACSIEPGVVEVVRGGG